MSASFNVTNLPKLRYGSTVDVQSAQVVDGTVLVDTSTWRMYVDLDGHRLDLNTPVPVATAADLPTQANRIPGKLYVALDTWTVYLSDGTAWHALEPWRYAVLPSGGTKGQVLVHGSDSGSYAWAAIEGGSGGSADYTPPLTFQFTSADIAGTLAWNAGHTEATVTHALPSVMLVQVLDADGALVQPDVTLASATTLKLGFGAEMDISDSSPWTATVYPAPGEPAAYADGNQY